jgi:hypothetical protein
MPSLTVGRRLLLLHLALAAANSASIRRACPARWTAAAVSSTRRLVRMEQGRPSSVSSLAIPADRVGCETLHDAAALEKLPWSITARK